MSPTIVLEFTAALIATVVLIWLFEPLARRMDWMDHPKGRKQHSHATPYHGGLAMFLGLVVVAVAVAEPTQRVVGLGIASGILVWWACSTTCTTSAGTCGSWPRSWPRW